MPELPLGGKSSNKCCVPGHDPRDMPAFCETNPIGPLPRSRRQHVNASLTKRLAERACRAGAPLPEGFSPFQRSKKRENAWCAARTQNAAAARAAAETPSLRSAVSGQWSKVSAPRIRRAYAPGRLASVRLSNQFPVVICARRRRKCSSARRDEGNGSSLNMAKMAAPLNPFTGAHRGPAPAPNCYYTRRSPRHLPSKWKRYRPCRL